LAVARSLPNGLTFADPPLFKYVLVGEYATLYGWFRLAGATHSPQEFVDQFRADPSRLYLTARITSAVFGAATSVAAGALGTLAAGRRAGQIAAGLTAIAFLLVRDSHFGVNDALVTLLVTVGLVVCLRILRGASWRDYVAAGALAGLAFAAKYDGIILLAPLVLAHLLGSAARRVRDLGLALFACVVGALFSFPSLVVEPGRVLHDIYVHLYLSAVGGYDGLDPSGGYVFYTRALLIGLGWPLLLASVAGLLLAAWRRRRQDLIVASVPVLMLGILGAQRLYFARFALPAIPALLVLASAALDAVVSIRPLIGLAAAVLVAVPSLADSVRFDVLLTHPDTRTLAREWIEAALPRAASIAVDAAPLGPGLSSASTLVPDGGSLFDLTLSELRASGVDFLVESSFTADAPAVDPAREARRIAFSTELQQAAAKIAQFRAFVDDDAPPFVYDQIYGPFNSLDQLERPGPTITIYRLTR
jgi:hypothetical protein